MHIETETDPDDRPFDGGMPGESGPKTRGVGDDSTEVNDHRGTCRTATCISFVTVGYCVVLITMAVAYRKHRPRDRSKQFDAEVENDEDGFTHDEQTEMLNPEFEQHQRARSVVSEGNSTMMRSFT